MQPPLCERLRQALRDFKQVAAARARLELETETGFRERLQVLEREAQDQAQRLDQAYQEGLAEAELEINTARIGILAQFEGDEARATHEVDKAKRGALPRYAQDQEQAEAEFKEGR